MQKEAETRRKHRDSRVFYILIIDWWWSTSTREETEDDANWWTNWPFLVHNTHTHTQQQHCLFAHANLILFLRLSRSLVFASLRLLSFHFHLLQFGSAFFWEHWRVDDKMVNNRIVHAKQYNKHTHTHMHTPHRLTQTTDEIERTSKRMTFIFQQRNVYSLCRIDQLLDGFERQRLS